MRCSCLLYYCSWGSSISQCSSLIYYFSDWDSGCFCCSSHL